jgi:predicted nucleic acid-binding protein
VTLTLVDTSVWVRHLRRSDPELVDALDKGLVVTHPFVIGELACGTMQRRDEFLDLLARLPGLEPVDHEEALYLVDSRRLWGRGLGWVDVHLIAAAIVGDAALWTTDRSLADAAADLGVSAPQ